MSKDINIDLNSVKAKLAKVPRLLRQYVVFAFAITILCVYGFLVWQINSLSNIPANEDKITQERQIIKKPQIDEATIDKIQKLQDQNIAVQSLFESARDNPFSDK